jgi:hypothetical protein
MPTIQDCEIAYIIVSWSYGNRDYLKKVSFPRFAIHFSRHISSLPDWKQIKEDEDDEEDLPGDLPPLDS